MLTTAKTILKSLYIFSVCIAGSGVALASTSTDSINIKWTKYGVPHVTAHNYKDLGFGYGYVLAEDRLCALADHFIGLRGERSKWYGPKAFAMIGFLPANNLSSDLFYSVQLSDALVAKATKALKPDTRDLTQGFVAGMNNYVSTLSAAKKNSVCHGKPVPAFEEADIIRALLSIGNTGKAFHVGPSVVASGSAWKDASSNISQSDVPAITIAEFNKQKQGFGSNAWVFGGDVTESDGALVLGNPHSSWADLWLSMHQVHLTIPGEIDVAGATFLGLPTPQTGFNKDIAWSILQAATVTWQLLQFMDVDETTQTYTVDGVQKPLQIKPVIIQSRDTDGTVSDQLFHMAYSDLGPLYKLPAGPGRPAGWYAVTDIGDGNARGLDQFLELARASNIAEFVAAVESNRGLGSHLVAGDRYGDAAFVEAGPLFGLTDDELSACRYGKAYAPIILDGSRSACSIRDTNGDALVATQESYPTLVTRKIIQNTNNSYKKTIFGEVQKNYSVLLGNPIAQELNPRTIMSDRQMQEISTDGVITPDEALSVIFNNRNFAAEEWLDDILVLCEEAVQNEVIEACSVLKSWDRKNNADSKGALLFHQFWNPNMSILKPFLPPHNPENPFENIPLNLTAKAKTALLDGLAKAVTGLKDLGFKPDDTWGKASFADTKKGRIELHGGSGVQGILNVEEPMQLTPKGFAGIMFGTAYTQLVRWENGEMVADTLLAHGQHGASPEDKAAQIQLFADKKLYRFPFTKKDLAKVQIIRELSF